MLKLMECFFGKKGGPWALRSRYFEIRKNALFKVASKALNTIKLKKFNKEFEYYLHPNWRDNQTTDEESNNAETDEHEYNPGEKDIFSKVKAETIEQDKEYFA